MIVEHFSNSLIRNSNSLFKIFKLAYFVIRTKFFSSKIRLLRFPIEIRGRKYINFGNGLTTGFCCRFEAFSTSGDKTLLFGNNIQINDFVHICSMRCVSIGDNVLIASKVYISDNSHGSYKGDKYDSNPNISPIKRDYYVSSVVIEDNVWIGEGVIILPGVKVGKGAIVGANSVVSKDIPPYTIAVGQPARVVKHFDNDKMEWIKNK